MATILTLRKFQSRAANSTSAEVVGTSAFMRGSHCPKFNLCGLLLLERLCRLVPLQVLAPGTSTPGYL